MSLDQHIRSFKKLRRDYKNGGAPHKPILLLSIIHLFEEQFYDSARIYFIPELVSTFKTIWSKLVVTNHDPNIALPFSHMRSEPFWRLVPNEGCEQWIESKASMRSFKNLKTAVDHALIDVSLYKSLRSKQDRALLTSLLLETYFAETKNNFSPSQFYRNETVYSELANDSPEDYQKRIAELKSVFNEDRYEEEIFVRSGIFKREIVKLYNNTCSISGLRINATASVTMVDACHIIPFSKSHDDTFSNGIALCPNLHRAFDRGLISIDNDYCVLVSNAFTESESDYGIKKYEGKKILLPDNHKHVPVKENVQWHRENIFIS